MSGDCARGSRAQRSFARSRFRTFAHAATTDAPSPLDARRVHRRQAGVPDVLDFLKSKHVKAAELLNSTPVAQRAEAIDGSQQGRINVLLSTDMASRGLDLPRLTHVINVHPPSTGRGYIHRAGRVGRMGRAGACITMVTAEQEPVFRKLARGLNIPLQTLRIEQGRAVVE